MLIGISGYAQAGKDTLARAFVKYGFERLAFADFLKEELKDFCLKNYGLDPFDDEAKKILRPLLVFHGAERRRQDPLYWVKKGVDIWKNHGDKGNDNYVISDVRYLNEVEAILEDGGVWFYVDAYGRGVKVANDEEKNSFNEIGLSVLNTKIPPAIHVENYSDLQGYIQKCELLAAGYAEVYHRAVMKFCKNPDFDLLHKAVMQVYLQENGVEEIGELAL